MGVIWASFRCSNAEQLLAQCLINLYTLKCCQVVLCAANLVLDVLDGDCVQTASILYIATVM